MHLRPHGRNHILIVYLKYEFEPLEAGKGHASFACVPPPLFKD